MLHPFASTSADFAAASSSPLRALAAYRAFFRLGTPPPGFHFPTPAPRSVHIESSTTKFTLPIAPASPLESESVILPITSVSGSLRHTLCLSSQVGCAMGCTFCETAQMGLLDNLSASQIIAQWFAARFHFRAPVSNIVFMGMGEPLHNLPAVLHALRILTDPNGPALAPSRITISTVGLPAAIRQLARFARQPGFGGLRLAVSINAPTDDLRASLMPINHAHPLADLLDAITEFLAGSRRRVLFEYVLIPSINDSLHHADQLAALLAPFPGTINLIPYNPRRNSSWPAPAESSIDSFFRRLQSHKLRVTRRLTLGRSVMAACGQLGNQTIRRRRFVHLTSAHH